MNKPDKPLLEQLDDQIAEAQTARALLLKLRKDLADELWTLNSQPGRPDAFRQDTRRDLELTLTQLDRGVNLAEGMDPRLYAVVTAPEVAHYLFHSPGLGPLDRLLARLRREREAEAARLAAVWPRPFRLREGKRHSLADRDLLPGEVIDLAEAQATSFGDKFEEVVPPKPATTEPTPPVPQPEADRVGGVSQRPEAEA